MEERKEEGKDRTMEATATPRIRLEDIEKELLQEATKGKEIEEFRPGDTVRVYMRMIEGDKEKIHPFEGVVIAVKGAGIRRTITVRKVIHGYGVERIFPLYSPNLVKLQVLRRGKVRRAKLYYLRGKKGKAAKIKERK